MIVQNSDFSRAVKTSSIFARDGSGILRIQIVNDEEGGKLSVFSRAKVEFLLKLRREITP